MDWVVLSFSRGSCASFVFNRHAIFRKPQDNREITATFSAKPVSIEELNSLTARLKKTLKLRLQKRHFCDLFCQFSGKFVESPRKVATSNNFKKCKTGGFARGGGKLAITEHSVI